MTICAVIPAAGRGSRLNADRPKLLIPLVASLTVWDVLRMKLAPFVDRIHVVVSPEGKSLFEAALAEKPAGLPVSIGVQPIPLGMGNAIFSDPQIFAEYLTVLVVWGDQVHVSTETFRRIRQAHFSAPRPCCTLPLVHLAQPYVEYLFSPSGSLVRVLQSREGDTCHPGGLGDVGTFLLSTAGILSAWEEYEKSAEQGSMTGEINFLPFLPFLTSKGFPVRKVLIDDPTEARGINTPADLAFFRSLYSKDDSLHIPQKN